MSAAVPKPRDRVWLGAKADARPYTVESVERGQSFAWRTVVTLRADDGTRWRYVGHVGRPIPWNARLFALEEVTSRCATCGFNIAEYAAGETLCAACAEEVTP